MGGIAKRSRDIERSGTEGPMVDNYAIFLDRIEDAQRAMRSKMDQNRRRINFMKSQWRTDSSTATDWERRVNAVNLTIECYEGAPDGLDSLSKLLSTAQSMHRTYSTKASALVEAIKQLEEQETPLLTHINQLAAAKGRLASAQAAEKSRNDLDQLVASTSQVAYPSIPVKEDQGLRDIRRLIAESEALLELKG